MPYMLAALNEYGQAVLSAARDWSIDTKAGLGRRLLQRILGVLAEGEALPEVLGELVQYPDDEDYLHVFSRMVRKLLESDSMLMAEVRAMLDAASGSGRQTYSGQSSY
jgi:hypothetical protein